MYITIDNKTKPQFPKYFLSNKITDQISEIHRNSLKIRKIATHFRSFVQKRPDNPGSYARSCPSHEKHFISNFEHFHECWESTDVDDS